MLGFVATLVKEPIKWPVSIAISAQLFTEVVSKGSQHTWPILLSTWMGQRDLLQISLDNYRNRDRTLTRYQAGYSSKFHNPIKKQYSHRYLVLELILGLKIALQKCTHVTITIENLSIISRQRSHPNQSSNLLFPGCARLLYVHNTRISHE